MVTQTKFKKKTNRGPSSISKTSLESSDFGGEDWINLALKTTTERKWARDEDVTQCKKCNTEFTLWIRKHHCRNCGQIFCYNCCSKMRPVSRPITGTGSQYPCEKPDDLFRVCLDCSESIDRQSEKYILWYIFGFLDLREIKNLMVVSKLYYEVGSSYSRALSHIQLLPLDVPLSNNERTLVLQNRHYLKGHTSYLFALLKADSNFEIGEFKQDTICENLKCHHGCRNHLAVEDYVSIVSICTCKSLKGDGIVNYCCSKISELITEEEAECLVTLLIDRSFIKSVSNLLLQLTTRSEKLLYLIYWQSLHSSKILMEEIEKKYTKEGGRSLELINYIRETYLELSLFNWKGPYDPLAKRLLFLNHDRLFLSETVVKESIATKASKCKPVILPFRDNKGQVKRFLYKRESLKRDFIVSIAIKLMIYYLQKELDLPLNLSPVIYSIYLLKDGSGLIEMVEDSYTIYEIRNHFRTDLRSFIFRMNQEDLVRNVEERFINSLAVYSVITYLLGIGDRHLDNIMVHKSGLFFHIDFEYVLGEDPKLVTQDMRITNDMLDFLGGKHSENYRNFTNRCTEIYNCLRKHNNIFSCLISLVANRDLSKSQVFRFLNERFNPCDRYLNAETYIRTIIDNSHDTFKHGLMDSLHRFVKQFR